MIGQVQMVNYSEYRGDWNPATWLYPDPATGQKISWRRLSQDGGIDGTGVFDPCPGHGDQHGEVAAGTCWQQAAVLCTIRTAATRAMSSGSWPTSNGARLSYTFNLFAQGVHECLTVVGDTGTLQRAGGAA